PHVGSGLLVLLEQRTRQPSRRVPGLNRSDPGRLAHAPFSPDVAVGENQSGTGSDSLLQLIVTESTTEEERGSLLQQACLCESRQGRSGTVDDQCASDVSCAGGQRRVRLDDLTQRDGSWSPQTLLSASENLHPTEAWISRQLLFNPRPQRPLGGDVVASDDVMHTEVVRHRRHGARRQRAVVQPAVDPAEQRCRVVPPGERSTSENEG